ncbi:MAG: transglutaminase-like cysteine peptidase [Neptuniibacter sp.]
MLSTVLSGSVTSCLRVGKICLLRQFCQKILHLLVLASLSLHNPAYAFQQQEILPAEPQLNNIHTDNETAKRFQQWSALINSAPLLSDTEKLVAVNGFFNQMAWVEDQVLWGEEDYWATPIESLLKNAGDCEDFSIAKYFTLLKMGIAEEKLRISYVILREGNQAHMVLSYYPDIHDDPLILDNLNTRIMKSSERDDLQLVFHINSMGIWHQSRPNEILGSASNVKKWRKMVMRLRDDLMMVTSDILLARIYRDLIGLPSQSAVL